MAEALKGIYKEIGEFWDTHDLSELLDKTNSPNFRTVSRISQKTFPMSWSHYILLMRIDNEVERRFYEIEAANQNWSVVDGTDQGGISKTVNWQGGGGFKYYYLAPSLLKEDKHGNWVIDERYNADMLAAAMAKHEGFRYSPDEQIYWKQGRSTEKDYIFTTTNFVTIEFLDNIHDEMQADESLLICCKSFSKACESRHLNITVRKIPKMLLGRCEFGKEDYSLNIVNMPVEENEQDPEPVKVQKKPVPKVIDRTQGDMFVEEGVYEE